jgi:hypothetical protein
MVGNSYLGVTSRLPVIRQFRKSGEIKKSKICKELFPEDEYSLRMSAEEREPRFQ